MDETTGAFESLLWSLGGIMLFTRSVVSSVLDWLRLPAGSSTSNMTSGTKEPPSLPRRSRLFTAAVLVAATLLFLSPDGREAIRTVRASWNNFQQSPSDRQVLEKLAARAEKENDATMLAFVAFSIDDPERATALADRAVSLDPNLVWIYGTVHLSAAGRDQRLQHLQVADPGNAVPVILAADSVADEIGAIYPKHLSPAQIQAMLAGNPKWMALMTHAFTLSRFDSYEQRRFQLTSRVWNREKDLSPAIVCRGSWPHGNPFGALWIFSTIRVPAAEKAFAAGDPKDGDRLLGEVDSFGERMADNPDSTLLGRAVGLDLVNSANFELAKLYNRAGRITDAQKVRSRIQQVKERQAGLWNHAWFTQKRSTFRRAGLLVQGFSILAVLSGLAALAVILLLELWPARLGNRKAVWWRILCRIADYAPAATLLSSVALLLSFIPFARDFSEYRAATPGLGGQEVFMQAIWQFGFMQNYGWQSERDLWLWASIIVLLVTLALLIVTRSLYRSRFATIVTLFVAGLVGLHQARAQAPRSIDVSRPTFETVSIKLDKSPSPKPSHQVYFPNRFVATLTARGLIEYAYSGANDRPGTLCCFPLNDDQISGGPAWIKSQMFDIDATVAASLVNVEEKDPPFNRWIDQIEPMVQSLLAGRFQLKIRHKTKNLPAYALVVAKNGPRFSDDNSQSREGVRALGAGSFQFTASPVRNLAWLLSASPEVAPNLGRRLVLDKTGLEGQYSFSLRLTQGSIAAGHPPSPDDASAVSASVAALSTALERQLGLRLEPATAPMDVIVIEHIEQPAEN
jgi:uncharacterized protein (TIGR03435 family)